MFLPSCGGGETGAGSAAFQLVQFLESGQANIPRNRILTFEFSAPVGLGQNFAERLKIQNLQAGAGSNFSLALGQYAVLGNRVIFVPRLPTFTDRSDAGFKANGNYTVYLKAGSDALRSVGGSTIPRPQEFSFDTSEFFEDPVPADPPRALGLIAYDTATAAEIDISRLDPRPGELALIDNNDLLTDGRVIDPGGGATFDAPWEFRLEISEPLDPSTVKPSSVKLYEIYGNATNSGPTAPPSAAAEYFGDSVFFPVPVKVQLIQGTDVTGAISVNVVVTPLNTLVDNTRYRLVFSGKMLGLDFRQTFIGENGLTGDGQTELAEAYPEPGGFGYTTEFIVRDRPTIVGKRTLTYQPLVDGIQPESGQTTADETLFNSALYNSPANPGVAVGIVGAFGGGKLGDLSVQAGTFTIDTGDTPNEPAEVTTPVTDPDPTDLYKNTNGFPTPGTRQFDSVLPTEFDFATISVAAGSTLKVIGVNPCRLLSAGLVQISGTIDAGGGIGGNGLISQPNQAPDAAAGAAGPGGFPGGYARSGQKTGGTQTSWGGCNSFDSWVSVFGGVPSAFPNSHNGEGPGRGFAGGETFAIFQADEVNLGLTGTGGGGGSHGGVGTFGEDRFNNGADGAAGSPEGQYGKCSQWGLANSGVIGIRSAPGPTYGDREALDFLGGSGGGAGGAVDGFNNLNGATGSGGGGGGGGGFLEILSAGPIFVQGVIDVSGGEGGNGNLGRHASQAWTQETGSGGGGSGGTLSLISGDAIDLSAGLLDARGGTGGPRPTHAQVSTCAGCNAGGNGGKGYIFLMDADGLIGGFNPGPPNVGDPGNYDAYANGILSIRSFDANRFGGASAVTELFGVRVADPTYTPMSPLDIGGKAKEGQTIHIRMSSASPDPLDPLSPDLSSEIALFEVATLSADGGGLLIEVLDKGLGVPGDIVTDLNPVGKPRHAFVRVQAVFDYSDPKEAALGPYLEIAEVTIRYTFN